MNSISVQIKRLTVFSSVNDNVSALTVTLKCTFKPITPQMTAVRTEASLPERIFISLFKKEKKEEKKKAAICIQLLTAEEL